MGQGLVLGSKLLSMCSLRFVSDILFQCTSLVAHMFWIYFVQTGNLLIFYLVAMSFSEYEDIDDRQVQRALLRMGYH